MKQNITDAKFGSQNDRKSPLPISYKLSVSGAAERLPKCGGHQEKRAPTKGNLKAKIYPYIVFTIFASLYTPYKILPKHHALQLGVMV